jgi:hypothetical protein
MFSKRTTAALFAIAVASSLIIASGFVGSAFAAKKEKDGETNTIIDPNGEGMSKSLGTNAGDTNGSPGDASNSRTTKDLKSLFKCQSGAAKDDDLTLAEVENCYRQVDEGQGQADQSSATRGNAQSEEGQPEVIKSDLLHGQKSGLKGLLGGFPALAGTPQPGQ